jgi:hypothetical protein
MRSLARWRASRRSPERNVSGTWVADIAAPDVDDVRRLGGIVRQSLGSQHLDDPASSSP